MNTCDRCRFAPEFDHPYAPQPCQRHAPTVEKVESWVDIRQYVPRWPLMHRDQKCGDFEPRAEAAHA
jgi:5-methylcytosine-specific restriction endonuclease McrA